MPKASLKDFLVLGTATGFIPDITWLSWRLLVAMILILIIAKAK